jgi:hypothetical protein
MGCSRFKQKILSRPARCLEGQTISSFFSILASGASGRRGLSLLTRNA